MRLEPVDGKIVIATLSAGPPTTKNYKKTRDPGMHRPMKGNRQRVDTKLYIGTDNEIGPIYSASVTAGDAYAVTRDQTCCMAKKPATMVTAPTGARNSVSG